MRNRMLFCGFLISLILWPLAIGLAKDTCIPASSEPIRLGAIFQRGQLMTVRSADPYQGAEAMRQAVNACGGVNGRPVEWVYEAASGRDEAEAAARRLIDGEHVPLIVGSGSAAVLEGASRVAEAAGVLYWEVTESIGGTSQWVVATRPNNRQLGSLTARFVEGALVGVLGHDALKVALVYEERSRGQQVAEGVRAGLQNAPLIEYSYSGDLYDSYGLAERIRNRKIDVVILAAFDNDGDNLWYALREADANIQAWIHIGSEGYRRGLCERLGNTDGFISVGASGSVSASYRQQVNSDVYAGYVRAYTRAFNRAPSETADLSASGVYLLFHEVLPNVEGEFTADAIREAALGLNLTAPAGLMGEGLAIDANTGLNQAAGVVVQQQQGGYFCTAWPEAIANCNIQPFPTWRERAVLEESSSTCRDHI